MRLIEVRNFGGPEVLEYVERSVPEAGAFQVVIKVGAIGINPVETYIRAGEYPVLPDLPYIPGGNCAGWIHEVGEGVTGFTVGQRVYTASKKGAYSEYCLCDFREIYPLPEEMSFNEGAALGTPAATAYRALFTRGSGRVGERVLVHGASGSVGLAAIQLGHAAGMRMYGTAGSEKGLQCILESGADGILLHHGKYTNKLQSLAPKGFDLILEMLANKNLEIDLSLLAPGGRVVIIGSRGRIEIDPRATMGRETDIRGLALANATREELMATHAALAVAMKSGHLKPVIADVLPMSQAAEAHRRVMESGKCGKILLIPDNDG